MQVGSCFINYEDFKQNFNSYKEESKTNYSIQSSVSVRYHNLRNKADVRQDITYTNVKFCCSYIHGHSRKRKSVTACPAYFILQYNEKLDRLVVKEENSSHVHTRDTRQDPSILIPLTNTSALPSTVLDTPSKKRCDEEAEDNPKQGSPIIAKSYLTQSVMLLQEKDVTETELQGPSPSSESLEGEIAGDALKRLGELMQKFLAADRGSKAIISIGSQQELEQLAFQTYKMGDLFVKFPESLLLHRVSIENGYVLYTFLVESKERVGKIVHFSFVRQDNTKSISKILSVFQDFNPKWTKVKIIFTDVKFAHGAVLKESFPSAQVLLSVYHTVRCIERNVKGKPSFKEWVRKLTDDAIFCTSPEKLSKLSEKLQYKMDEDLYDYLCANWFSCELLWYMHVKKGLHACSTYMDSLGMVLGKVSNLFAKQSSWESTIQQFVEKADCFNSKGLENQIHGSLCSSKKSNTVQRSRNKVKFKARPFSNRPIAPAPSKIFSSETTDRSMDFLNQQAISHSHRPIAPAPNSFSVRERIDGSKDFVKHYNLQDQEITSHPSPSNLMEQLPFFYPNSQDADVLLQSLQEHCNELGFSFSSQEWEVVKRSTHLINAQKNYIGVQILEESHLVSVDGQSCTCYFNYRYKLPCRHILSMLYTEKRPIERAMVDLNLQTDSETSVSEAQLWNSALCFSGSEVEAKEREFKIKSLTKEFSNLLLQCDGPELTVRCSTLQMIVDIWNQESSSNKEKIHDLESRQVLPYQWVKKEKIEGEETSGSHELCRLDAFPVLS
ncbi:zinc finger SWIM domain-containing protein 3 [Pelodytes ibericus]